MMGNTAELNYFGHDLEAMSFAQNYHGWIADEFVPYLGEEIAEVGAGSGDFTELILEHVLLSSGSQLTGVIVHCRLARVQTNELEGRDRHSSQKAYDDNHDHDFNEGKTLLRCFLCIILIPIYVNLE